MRPLPFSGLSLLFHVGIIAISALLSLVGFERSRTKGLGRDVWYLRIMRPVASVAILLTVGGFTAAFIGTALETGIRTGADEPLRMYVDDLIH